MVSGNCCSTPIKVPPKTFLPSCAYGLINYLYFGDSTCSIIMLNLSRGPLAAAAKLGIAADLFLSFPITLAAAREAIELSAFAKNTQWRCLKQSGVSVALICGSYVFTFIPSFSVIVNVVGGWSVALFCFVLPPLMLLNLRHFHSSAILHLMSSEDTNHRVSADEKTPLPATAFTRPHFIPFPRRFRLVMIMLVPMATVHLRLGCKHMMVSLFRSGLIGFQCSFLCFSRLTM